MADNKSPLPELMQFPIDRACAIKFAKGQLEHGVEFTDDAVVEAHNEFLDAVNYCNKGIEQGYNANKLKWVRGHVVSLCQTMREIYAEKHGIDNALLPPKSVS